MQHNNIAFGKDVLVYILPGLNQAALPGNVGFSRQVDCGEEDIGHFVAATAVAIGELSRKRYIQLIVWYVTKPTARGHHLLKSYRNKHCN